MDDNYKYHKGKREGKTYVSPRITRAAIKEGEHVLVPEVRVRIASKVFENAGSDHFARIKDELVIRRTEAGKQEIRAVFFEDDRGLESLSIQRYGVDSNKPYQSAHFSFRPDEIEKIVEFLTSIKLLNLPDEAGINLSDPEIRNLLVDKGKLTQFLHAEAHVVREFVRNEVTGEDIIALAYRKKQLEVFGKLLDRELMGRVIEKKQLQGEEKVWQAFFEKNPWIFGYGLNYVFSSRLDHRPLELSVKGHDLKGGGKRIDALLKSLGLINSLCYVEIKKASTRLLGTEYRSGCWSINPEVAGGVSQVQNSIELAIETLGKRFEPSDDDGFPTGEVLFNYKPKGFLVVGRLDEFLSDHRVNSEMFRSFELFRRNLQTPEILTFDELYQRAKAIVEAESEK
ncbi:MAG: Shedu immune nuclease family protein [Pseudomonadota bacterium]